MTHASSASRGTRPLLVALACLTLGLGAAAQARSGAQAAHGAHGAHGAAGAGAAKAAAAKGGAEMHAYGAWARATPPGSTVTAAYVSFHNPQAAADRLLEVSTPLAKRSEVHETRVENGVAKMRRVEALTIAPDQALKMAPGGTHLMLMGLTGPLQAGQKVPLRLRFENAGVVEVQATVRAPEAGKAEAGKAEQGGHAHH
mgnify:CR=1 FL=1